MLVSFLAKVTIHSTFISIAFLLCGFITALTQGTEVSLRFLKSCFWHWNGVLVWGTAYGTMHFARAELAHFSQSALALIEKSETDKYLQAGFAGLNNFGRESWFALVIVLLGSATLLLNIYPYTGFPQFALIMLSCLVYYPGAWGLIFLVKLLRVFWELDQHNAGFSISKDCYPTDINLVSQFLSTASIASIIALYLAFRGSLTADLENIHTAFRPILAFPLLMFLPAVFVFNYYPRAVLNRVNMNTVSLALRELRQLKNHMLEGDMTDVERLNREASFMDLESKLMSTKTVFPLFSARDLPAYLIGAGGLLFLIYSKDPVLQEFVAVFQGH